MDIFGKLIPCDVINEMALYIVHDAAGPFDVYVRSEVSSATRSNATSTNRSISFSERKAFVLAA